MDKSELRILGLQKRKSLNPQDRKLKDAKILHTLEQTELFHSARRILAYFSHHTEVETRTLLDKWQVKKDLFLPVLTDEEGFQAYRFVSFDNMVPNRFNIAEPLAVDEPETRFDMILVPGVVFDRQGNRIGMGKGYYDRFLKEYKTTPKVALAFSEQILESIPKEPYDEPVDWIITEDELIRCQS